MTDALRAYNVMTRGDLARLARIADIDLEDRFRRKPRWRLLYSQRVIAVALCQGAALHYIDGVNGVKDFDVWTFFSGNPEVDFPPRWRTVCDFGDDKFGQSSDRPDFVGRRVDLIGRSIPAPIDADPVVALQQYLSAGRTVSARLLANKAVVLLKPDTRLGEIAWPARASRTKKSVDL